LKQINTLYWFDWYFSIHNHILLIIFYAVLSALDNMGFVTNMVSLVLYFYGVMHFDLSSSANTLTNFMGSTFLLSLVGAFISDTYLNRLTTCLLFGSLEVIVSILN
jgi:peptide/histidine transporter 3/4